MKKINIKEIDTKRIFCTLLPPVMAFTVNCMVYWGAPLFTVGRTAYNLSGNLDDLVPFLPPFIVVYLGCYIFWVINYLLISAQGDEHRYRFFTADICSRLVCLVIFVVFPTTNTRPELIGHDIWTQAVRALYQWDAPQNLFPSIHCLVSWMLFSLNGCPKMAVVCLAVSGFCDMFDGKIARTKKNRTEVEKRFGIQIDSLADIICFGVAPSLIAYRMGMNHIVGIAILMFYVLAGLIRLAWFNVSEEIRQNETEENRECYQGLPITSMAIALPILVVFRPLLEREFIIALHALVLVIGLLFITNFRLRKPKKLGQTIMVIIVALAVLRGLHVW